MHIWMTTFCPLSIIKDAHDRGNRTPHLGRTQTWAWKERDKEIKE
jgi:hypothetical protein